MKTAWRWVSTQTLRGLLLLVPAAVTVVFVVWLSTTIEASLKPVFEVFLPQGWYVPGLALLLFLLSALALGLLMRNMLMRTLLEFTERWMVRLPLVGSVYPVVRQLTDLFSGKNQGPSGSVVLVSFPDLGAQVIGIVTTGAEATGLAELPAEHDLVYIPMSYGIGGFTLILPRTRLKPMNMKPGEALQMVMMGGIGQARAAVAPNPPVTGV